MKQRENTGVESRFDRILCSLPVFQVYQKRCCWKVNIGNIEKSTQYCLNENINHSLFIKWAKRETSFKFFYPLLISMYKDTFKTFSTEISDVKIPWNAKSRRYSNFIFNIMLKYLGFLYVYGFWCTWKPDTRHQSFSPVCGRLCPSVSVSLITLERKCTKMAFISIDLLFLVFWGICFVGTPKTTQTGNWD